ncbi:MAG: protein kinase [Nakamurella sp.]
MTFNIGAYRAVERPGAGHHAAPAGLWRGEDLRTIDDVALTVLPADCVDSARSGVEQVRSLRHPHLLPVTDVVADEDRVAIICPWPRAGRLSELVSRRGRLTPAESLTVLLPLAGALSLAHSQGIRHGGVCPEAIWFDASGRPMLGAIAVGRIVAALNRGMPAACRDVAPEVVRGDSVEGPAAAAADVFSLGSVALFCLTGRSAWPADDPVDVLVQSAAGLWPDPPDDGGPALLIALIRAMLLDDPPNRPTAATVAQELAVIGEPAAIVFGSGPAPAAASADRWRGWSSQRSGPVDVQGSVGQPRVEDRTGAGQDDGESVDADHQGGNDGAPGAGHRFLSRFRSDPAARAELLTRAPAGPIDMAEPARPTPLAKVGIALLAGLLITLVAAQAIAWARGQDDPAVAIAARSAESAQSEPVQSEPAESEPAQPDSPQPDSAQPASTEWSALVEQLDQARGAALAQADDTLLQNVYTVDAPAKGSDAATIDQLAAQGWHVLDAVHQISAVTLLDPPAAGSGDDAIRLAVVDALPARQIVDGAGQQVGVTAARSEQRRILLVRQTAAGYRISDIQPG